MLRPRLRPLTGGLGALVCASCLVTPVLAGDFPRVTANLDITQADKRPARAHSTPYVLADPSQPQRVMVSEAELRTRTCRIFVSHDGGATMVASRANPMPPSFDFCSVNAGGTEAPMAFAPDGALVVAMHAQQVRDPRVFSGGSSSLVVSRSTDEGASWQSTIVVDNRGKDPTEAAFRPHIVSDPKHGRLAVSYTRSWTPAGLPARISRPYVVVSTDGGKSFGTPVDMSAGTLKEREGAGTPALAVAPNGDLFSLYKQAPFVPPGAPPVFKDLALSRSTDGGKTWTVSTVQKVGPFTDYPELAISAQGSGYAIVAAFEDLAADPAAAKQQVREIFIRRSTDGGKTFSDRIRLPDDPPGGFANKFTPGIVAAPGGRLTAAWYDFRNDGGKLKSDVYATWSEDGGRSWAKNVRISDRGSDRHIGPFANNGDVRGAVGVGASDYASFFGWDDSRNGDVNTQSQDVYFAAVQLEALPAPATSNLLAYGAAVFAGLVGAAIILFGAAVLFRRRRRQSVPAPA